MKLVGVMSLKERRQAVRDLLKEHGVQIYSETEIIGHTTATIAKYGWFATPKDVPDYSTLCFAIIADDEAEAIFAGIAEMTREDTSDHPVRAFLVPVEKMV